MNSPDAFLYEYSVVRYVPRVDREEFINIGLIMMCKRQKWLHGKIKINEERLKAFDRSANINCLEHQTRMFSNPDIPDPELPVEEKYRWLASVKSAIIQTSPSHPGVINRPNPGEIPAVELLESEFRRLFAELVE